MDLRSSAEEASYTAAAARDAAVNAATDVSQVAKAALDAAKVAGATKTEQVAAAAVAASDVAKKQGANPEQAAEVAAAAVSLLKCSWATEPPDAPGSTLTHKVINMRCCDKSQEGFLFCTLGDGHHQPPSRDHDNH